MMKKYLKTAIVGLLVSTMLGSPAIAAAGEAVESVEAEEAVESVEAVDSAEEADIPEGEEELLESVEFVESDEAEESVEATESAEAAENTEAEEADQAESGVYTLDKVTVLSRHNIRSPLSGSGSLLGDITPHAWFEWTSKPSELSLRGATLETVMGQYFRLWLESEGLFPENYRPADGDVRFYANSKQRTLATARSFSVGLLPVGNVRIESHGEYDTMDPVFNPRLLFVTDDYQLDVNDQIAELGGFDGMEGIHNGLMDAISKVMDVTDMAESEAYRSGQFGDLVKDETTVSLEAGKEPSMSGPIKTATSVADALTFQYYEMGDDKAAAFGHDISFEDWKKMHSIVDTYTEMLFGTPLLAIQEAHLLLRELRSELSCSYRKFSFLCGHDSNIVSVLSALGAEEYECPETVEPKTPIGSKLVFSRWLDAEGDAFYDVSLVYQSTEQLRHYERLTLDNPPMKVQLHFEGVETDDNGMIPEEAFFDHLNSCIQAYDSLRELYNVDAEGWEEVQPAA